MKEWESIFQNGEEVYDFLVKKYMVHVTGLDRLDDKMKGNPLLVSIPEKEMEEEQRKGEMGLCYIYLKNTVHMERLTPGERTIFEKMSEMPKDVKLVKNAMEIVQRTFRKVLAFVEKPETMVEVYPSLYGEGIVPSNTILFVIASRPDYDEEGNLRDWKLEEKRQNLMFFLKEQIEIICERALDVPVRVRVL